MAILSDEVQIDIFIPTAPNTLLLVNENITANLLKGQSADIQLPSLYKRAYLIVNQTDETAVARQGESA